jgi:hypothetical protein
LINDTIRVYELIHSVTLCECRGRDRIVVGCTTIYAIGAYHHWCCGSKARCTTLGDKVCQWLAAGWWFSPGPPVSSTNKTDRYDITKILLKVALNTIKPNQPTKLLCELIRRRILFDPSLEVSLAVNTSHNLASYSHCKIWWTFS